MKSINETMSAKSLNTVQRDRDNGPHIDVNGIIRQLNLRTIQYEEELPGQSGVDPKHRETRMAHFVHEAGMETGLKFYKRREMAELLMQFSVQRLVDREASLVQFGGRRGCRVSTTMSEADRQEVARKRAELEAMKEQSAPGQA